MSLFASFLVPLEPVGMRALPRASDIRDALLPPQGGDRASRELRAELHDDDQGRPVTVSDPFLTSRGYVVRVTALRADLAVHVVRRLGDGRRIGGGLRVQPLSEWGAKIASAGEFLDDKPASAADRIDVTLLTPTSFRGGDRGAAFDVPLPEPARIVRSWLSRLELAADDDRAAILAGTRPDAIVAWVRTSVRVSRFALFGEPVSFRIRGGDQRLVATHGWIVLHTEAREGPERRALRALARLSLFTGTGRKTVHGLGQTFTVVNGRDPGGEERAFDDLLGAHEPFGESAGRLPPFA